MSFVYYLADESGLTMGRKVPPHMKKYALLFLIANEIRGVMVAWPLADAWFF